MTNMFNKICLLMVLTVVSCTSNKELVSYEIDNKVSKVTIGETLKDFQDIYAQILPQDINHMQEDPKYLKMLILSRMVDPALLTHEALMISNFKEDPTYIAELKRQEKLLPYYLAFQEGQKIVSETLKNKTIELAEVSRIMLTNSPDSNINQQTLEKAKEILALLKESTNLVVDFANIAEKESHEPLGVQSGGYLYQITRGTYPMMDEIVFDQKIEGLYPELLQDDQGIYIVFVHTKAKNSKLEALDKYTFSTISSKMQQEYIADNIQYLYTMTGDNIIVDDQTLSPSTINDDTKILKIWNKDYTLGDIKKTLEIFNGGRVDSIDNSSIFELLAPPVNSDIKINALTYQIGVLYKGYSPSIVKTKKFKNILAEEHKALELNSVYAIISKDLYKDMATNVTDSELQSFYEIKTNRIVKSYDAKDTPIYASIKESKNELIQKILIQRAETIRKNIRIKLSEKYKVQWNEENLKIFEEKMLKQYDNYTHSKQ